MQMRLTKEICVAEEVPMLKLLLVDLGDVRGELN